ncbi:MAG: hypothetical protein RL434_2971 [Pseudomonadota bacterium]|jgi:hypothetical protein
MTPKDTSLSPSAEEVRTDIDFSDLLGVNQAFPAIPDAARQTELIDAHCNKIGSEAVC